MLKMGVSRAVINPSIDHPQVNWGAQSHILAQGIEADFWSTVLILTDGLITTAIVDLDLCLLTPAQSDHIRNKVGEALGIDDSCVRVSTGHTHAGPLTSTDYYEDKRSVLLEYIDFITRETVEAAIRAKNTMVPVTVGAGIGECGIARNRRQLTEDGRVVVGVNEEGITDPLVSVIRFDDESGNAAACIVHYSMHPTILGPANQLFSPEYPGVTKRIVESIVGGTCLFLQGAAGNIGPGKGGFTDLIQTMSLMGRTLGCEASKVLLGISTTLVEESFMGVVESGARLGVWSQTKGKPKNDTLKVAVHNMNLPINPQMPLNEAKEIALGFQKQVAALHESGESEEQIKDATYKMKRAIMAADRSKLYYGVSHKEIEAHFICIGDIALIGMPIEPFSEIGIAICANSPFEYTLFSGYSNGWFGYLPTESDYALGGYEVETTPFAQGSAEMLVENILHILKLLK